jgi:outer membrane protein OmpA-like peptidoglycan-associated protein
MDGRHLRAASWVHLRPVLAVAWALAGLPPTALAAELTDVKGGKDHPLVSRYAGSVMLGHRQQFDELVLPLAPVKPVGDRWAAAKELRVEGEATSMLYLIPEGRSTLEVLRNYERELGRVGFQVLYTCAGSECNDIFTRLLYVRKLKYGNPSTPQAPWDLAQYALDYGIQDARYLVLKRAGPDAEAYVSLFVGVHPSDAPPQLKMRTIALLDVVVKAGMDAGMVTVDAATMAREVRQSGHVALYGVLFDTDKDVVKPESEPALLEIAKLLKQDAALKLYVVGHTDNVGSFDHNMTLSNRRAAAVVEALTGRHGIVAPRLRAVGVGPAAPVAPNDKEAGRAKNRRVELVAQ